MAYNVLSLTSLVRRKLKDNSYSASDILSFLNDAQSEIADLHEWTFFEALVEGAGTQDEYTFEQQDNHQVTNKLVLVDPDDSAIYKVMDDYYLPYEEFFERFPVPDAHDSAWPTYWTEYGDQLYFNCPMDKAYKIRRWYIRDPVDLDDNADVPELPVSFREALVLGAAYRAEEQRDNYDYAAVLQQKFNDRVGDLINKIVNRQNITPEVVVLGRSK